MNNVIQVFILAILPSIAASSFYIMIHDKNDSYVDKFFDNILYTVVFLTIYVFEVVCIS